MSDTRPDPDRETYDAADLAKLLGVSESHVRRHPPVTPIRVGRRLLFPRAAVLELLGKAGGTNPATSYAAGVPARVIAR